MIAIRRRIEPAVAMIGPLSCSNWINMRTGSVIVVGEFTKRATDESSNPRMKAITTEANTAGRMRGNVTRMKEYSGDTTRSALALWTLGGMVSTATTSNTILNGRTSINCARQRVHTVIVMPRRM